MGTAPQLRRLVKISGHTAVVVDVPADGRKGREYDPWNPGDSWDASLRWSGTDRLQISVGPYHLDARRVNGSGELFFKGIAAIQ